MLYLIILAIALWNGWVILWKRKNLKVISNQWHDLGFFLRVALSLYGFYYFMPSWFDAILNPLMLLPGKYHAIGATVLLLSICGYWLYNLIINIVNGWDPYYQKYLPKNLYKISFWAAICIFVAWMISGIFFQF